MRFLGYLLFFTLCLGAAGQTQQPAATPQKSKPISGGLASIEGTVVNSQTGKPLDGVHVMLASYDARSSPDAVYGAMTDTAGHFSIQRVPPARYLLLLERKGFLFVPGAGNKITAHGWLPVKAGDQVRDLALEMVASAIISGRVLDAYGDPFMDADVIAIPVPPTQDLGFTLQSRTNDRGEFRIVVPPGKYHVKADLRFQPSPGQGPPEVRTDGTTETHYVDTYYPGAATVAEAALVETRPGRELSGVDLTLARSPVLAIRGAVSGVAPGCRAEIQAFGRGPFDRVYSSSPDPDVDPAGTSQEKFEIAHLPSGEYEVYAHAQCAAAEDLRLSSVVEVTLTDSNVEDLNLVLAPGANVSGTVEVSGRPAKSSPGESWRVSLQPIAEAASWLRSQTDTAPDGSFTVKNIFAQRYRVDVSPLPENGFVKSVSMNETASSDRVLDFSSGADGIKLKIVLGLDGAQVSGQVKYKDDALAANMLVLLLPDRTDFDLEVAPRVSSNADGRYNFKGLAPGSYKIMATKWRPGTIFYYAPLLKHLADKADVIEVKEGEELHKDLKLVDSEATDESQD